MYPQDSLYFVLVTNDTRPASCAKLIQFKSIISKALPNMDKPHIIRLLFDARHESLIAYDGNEMIGGASFIEFKQGKFIQLAFLAVKADKRVQGYGRKIMNRLKSLLQKRKIQYMVTYGDNMALGFFRKQGFSDKLTIPAQLFHGYIKQYDGGKLMQCKIHQTIDYLVVEEIIKKQKRFVIQKIKELSMNDTKFSKEQLLQKYSQNQGILKRQNLLGTVEVYKNDPRVIPGVIQSGWNWNQHDLLKSFEIEPFGIRCQKLLNYITRHPEAKYFLLPVIEAEVPEYHSIIKNPMDFLTIKQKLRKNQYKDEEQICKDIDLIFQNCFTFNHPESVYYKSGAELKRIVHPEVEAFRHFVINTEKIQRSKQKGKK